jgi:cobalt-zinc-cadmium efflux system outer membrane protein
MLLPRCSVLFAVLGLAGCAALRTSGPDTVAERAAPESAPIQRAAYQSPERPPLNRQGEKGGAKEGNGEAKKEGAETKPKITLPMAIELCVTQNFRVLAGADRVRQAEADLITASLIPNPSLFADSQLIPLQKADIDNQLGPPQYDALLSLPIDWWLFGKRVAAMKAARLGIDVSNADQADLLRAQVGRTVDAFYEILADQAYFRLAEQNVEELEQLEKITEELARMNKVGKLETDRIKLAVLEAVLDRHDRELALEVAKTKLRPLIGRTAADPDYELDGTLAVRAVVPPPKLADAVALAEAHRPDLISDLHDIDRARATVELERKRGKPQVAIQPGWSYQDQSHQTRFRNGSMFDIGISTTLPLTDRNQGNIARARARVGEAVHNYQGDRADVLAEVEAAVAVYDDAVEHLTLFNKRVTLNAALDLHRDTVAAYRAGDRKLPEVLLAQQAYRDRLAHVVEFESTYWRALYRLNTVVGLRAYDPDTGATQPVGEGAEKK